MTLAKKSFGALGEKLALDYLLSKGFEILHTNHRSRYGEIDIIARRTNKIHFVEVKTRSSLVKGQPYEAVNYFKRKHLDRAIQYYVLQNRLGSYKLSLDVISILINQEKGLNEIKHFEGV